MPCAAVSSPVVLNVVHSSSRERDAQCSVGKPEEEFFLGALAQNLKF